MAQHDPKPVYQKTDSNGLDYWTLKASLDLEAELKKIEHPLEGIPDDLVLSPF